MTPNTQVNMLASISTLRPNLVWLGAVLLMITSCSDDDATGLRITDVTPDAAAPGATVTITGSQFSATAAENVVKFNGAQAMVTAATATSLTVIVPDNATDGKITVTVQNETATSPNSFTIPQPEVTRVFPGVAAQGMAVTISGSFFSPVPEYNVVEFNGVPASITEVSDTELTVVVPLGATSGPLTLTVGSQTVTLLDEFEICSDAAELVISEVVVSPSEDGSEYYSTITIVNVGSDYADLSMITRQNFASTDKVLSDNDIPAGGYKLNAPIIAPGESYTHGPALGVVTGGTFTSHPYLIVTLHDDPGGSVAECDVDNNVVVVPFME